MSKEKGQLKTDFTLDNELDIKQIQNQADNLSENSNIQTETITESEKSVSERILVSISENINTMAQAISESEAQKQKVREDYVKFFKRLLIALIIFAGSLICIDTFLGECFELKTEFLISVMSAIFADIFAIVHTIVKYMTNVEHYDAYNKLIDSLSKHLDADKTKK